MRLLRAIPALALTGALLLGSAGALTVHYDGLDFGYPDELARQPAFQEGLDRVRAEAEAKGWDWEEFSAAMDAVCQQANEQLIQEMYEEVAQEYGEMAQCDFDPATGTVLRVTNDAEELTIPTRIGGVEVKSIAPGAVAGKALLKTLTLPPTVVKIDRPVAVDCAALQVVSADSRTLVTCKLYENCPKADALDLTREYYEVETRPIYREDGSVEQKMGFLDLPKKLMTHLKVFQGSDKGMNWTGALTRAEAATILLRLLGLEEEAKSAAAGPCPFTDVPDWARGYVNLAYEQGMVKGVGGDRFDPSGLCKAREFSLMLLRLTDHREGTDYAWATAVTDAQRLIHAGNVAKGVEENDYYGETILFPRLYNDNLFSREYACALAYRMLSAPMADGETSLGDVLCVKNGLSTADLSDFQVRLTAAALGDRVDQAKLAQPEYNMGRATILRTLFIALDEGKKAAAAQHTVQIPDEVQTLVDGLVAGVDSDYDKARTICAWVAEHIAYDYDTFEDRADDPQDVASVLANRRAVCAGFSNLTQAMMAAADIPCLYVSGMGGGDLHAWNEVYAGGRWFPVDNTWDCTQDYRYGATALNIRGDRGGGRSLEEHVDSEYLDFYCVHSLNWANLETPPGRYFS